MIQLAAVLLILYFGVPFALECIGALLDHLQ